jgi:hypothetical protein
MKFTDFSDGLVFQNKTKLSLANRDYLLPIHQSFVAARRTVLCAGRQVEKTTILLKYVLWRCCAYPGSSIIYVLPRQEQIFRLVQSRLDPMLRSSPVVARLLCAGGKTGRRKRHKTFKNGSELIFEAAHLNADATRGVSAETAIFDEYQDLPADALPVVEECQSHAANPHTIISGTSKLAENPLEIAFQNSTQNQWRVACAGCGIWVPFDSKTLTVAGFVCPQCAAPLAPRHGLWTPQNPDAVFAHGFRLPQALTPWTSLQNIQDKKATYDELTFKNEVWGEPVALGELRFDLNALLAACENRPCAQRLQDLPAPFRTFVAMGIDYGHRTHSTTVVCVVGFSTDYAAKVFHFSRFPPGKNPDEIVAFLADVITRFRPKVVGADGVGHGDILNPLVFERTGKIFKEHTPLFYSMEYTGNQTSAESGDSNLRRRLVLPKTKVIGSVLARLKAKSLNFFEQTQAKEFLVDLASERAVVDPESGEFRYKPTPGKPDDALHALTYALCAGQQAFWNRATY